MSNQHVFINSKNRISGKISNFDLLIKNLDYSVDEYTLLVKEVIIPKTFYNISSNNNITTQNYNATQFLTEFNSNSIGITAGYNINVL